MTVRDATLTEQIFRDIEVQVDVVVFEESEHYTVCNIFTKNFGKNCWSLRCLSFSKISYDYMDIKSSPNFTTEVVKNLNNNCTSVRFILIRTMFCLPLISSSIA